MRRAWPLLAALLAFACWPAPAALAAEPVQIAGTWNVVTEQTGTGTKSEYQDTYEETKGGVVTGHGTHGGQTWTIKGGVFGSTLKISTGPEGGPYEMSVTAAIAASANEYEGTFKDSEGHEGSVKATRAGSTTKEEGGPPPPPPPPPAAHATSLSVSCGYQPLSSQDTCTATVADLASAPSAPGGTVMFGASPAVLFALGQRCTLAPSTSAPATSSCSVVLVAAAGTASTAVSASYGGDSLHTASSGGTSLPSPGGQALGYQASGPRGSFPRDLILEIALPAPGSEVRVSVTNGVTGSTRQRVPSLAALPGEGEEREQEASPAALEAFAHELEGRERAYANQLVALDREAAEAKRLSGGLASASQSGENAIVTAALAAIAQIEQLRHSPGLQRVAASSLARLAAEREQLRRAIALVAKRQREETSAVGPPHGRLLVVGFARGRGSSATLKLRVKLRGRALRALARGRRSLTLELRVAISMPSRVVAGGVPVGTIQKVELVKRR